MTQNFLLAAALDLAAKKWPVFPCSPENKQPLTPKDSSPGAKDGGLYAATTSIEIIEAWWKRWPKAMIGVPTGSKIGTFVIDLDPREHSADEMLEGLRQWLDLPSLPPCPMSRTQSGGLHLFFKMPDEKVGNRAGLFAKIADAPASIKSHVDVRGDGGYVIVAPSVMATGKAYAWESEPDADGFPDAPEALLAAVLKKLDARPSVVPQTVSERASGHLAPRPTAGEAIDKARHRYAMAALDREIGELAAMGQGGRNAALNKAAFSLGGLVGAGILSESLARRELYLAAEKNGLLGDDGAEQVLKTIESGFGSGLRSPIDITQIGARVGTPQKSRGGAAPRLPDDAPPPSSSSSPAPSIDDQEDPASQWGELQVDSAFKGAGGKRRHVHESLNAECAVMPLTDLGNAQRFVRRFGKDFLYVEQWGWLAWDGKRWNAHEAEAILSRAVHATIKLIAEEASEIRFLHSTWTEASREDRRLAWIARAPETAFIDPCVDVKKGAAVLFSDRISGWSIASQANSHIICIARIAQAYLTASPDDFDKDLMAFNVDNGTLHFAKSDEDYVQFKPHNREERITKITPVVFDPKAQCPIYDGFLGKVQPDDKMRRHLHAWGGVSLTGLPLAKLSFWYGKGRNGKSTLIDVWAHVIGEYSQSIRIESFLEQGRASRGSEASPDIASLPGVRCLRTSEPEKNAQIAEALVKQVTGGEPLRARHLNKDFFEFRPAFKLTMQGNYRPKVIGTDEGFWRRMLLVPWSITIGEDEVDEGLPDKLRAESSGILNRLLDGLRDYMDYGLSAPDEVIEATADYRDDSDPVGQFLNECTTLGLKPKPAPAIDADGKDIVDRVAGKEIYDTYVAWCGAYGERPWSPKAFSRGLQDHGIKRIKSSGVFYLGLAMVKFSGDFDGMKIEADFEPKKR